MKNKLFLNLTGGLGNQLYIAATGISLAKITNMPLEFDISGFKKYKLHKLSVDKILPNLKFNNKLFKVNKLPLLSNKLKPIYFINELELGFDKNFYKRIKSKPWFMDLYLKGYFQSISYFLNILPELKKEIQGNLKKKYEIIKKDKNRVNFSDILTYHIRRKDKLSELNKSIYGFVDIDDHIKIIEDICYKNNKNYLLLLGDDTVFLKKLKEKLNINKQILLTEDFSRKKSQFLDFFLMINSSSIILSNSSFSLWAGYLSDSKEIYYPKPIFPYPRNKLLTNLTYEDLIMPSWESYKSYL